MCRAEREKFARLSTLPKYFLLVHHSGSRERRAALTLRWKGDEAGANFCHLGGRAVARDHFKLLLDRAAALQIVLAFHYSCSSPVQRMPDSSMRRLYKLFETLTARIQVLEEPLF